MDSFYGQKTVTLTRFTFPYVTAEIQYQTV